MGPLDADEGADDVAVVADVVVGVAVACLLPVDDAAIADEEPDELG